MKILFVCTGNSCRSPMAQGYMQKRLDEMGRKDVEVISAGTILLVGAPATIEAQQVIREAGGDISKHTSRRVSADDVRSANFIFVMEKRHRQYLVDNFPEASKKIFLLKEFKNVNSGASDDSDIPDPIGQDIGVYREVFEIIKASVERILNVI